MRKVLEYVIKNLRSTIDLRKASQVVDKVVIIDKVISQAEIFEVSGRRYVRKRYDKEIGIFKWLPPSLMLKDLYPFTLNPKERLLRELNFFSNKWSKFYVPKIVSYDLSKLELVREYVDGSALTFRYSHEAEALGIVLGEIHSKNYALGDLKPTNFIIKDSKIYIIDAEQAITNASLNIKCWDIVCLSLFASYVNLFNIDKFKDFMLKLLKSYVAFSNGFEILKYIQERYFNPLALLIPLPHILILDNVLNEVLSSMRNE